MTQVTTVVFDVGNVLIAWDPRNLYRKLIDDEAEIERFLAEVCTHDWNLDQDRGGSTWAEAVAERVALFPEHEALIRAFDERWPEMIPGAIEGSVAILHELADAGVPLYGITNFSAEKYVLARARFPFLDRFRDTVVSAHERLLKPEPEIYRRLLRRNALAAGEAVFIDDAPKNVAGAEAVGMKAIHFRSPEDLRDRLIALGLPLAAA
ncbi:MAG TPA: HAD family phosphatase [Methylomirabilota bacterium]|nr:HAD family phosphatase [Methylomirabilota bacterium]